MLKPNEIILLCVTVAFAVIAIACGVVLGIFKKNWLRAYFYAVIGSILIYAITIISLKFERFEENYQIWLSVIIGLIILIYVVMLAVTAKTKNTNTRKLVFAGIVIALSFALSYVKLFRMPFGGSVTFFSLLPLILFSYTFGLKDGLLVCFVYGVMQSIQDPWIVHPIQYFLDYPVAYTMVGFSGIFANKGLKPLNFIYAVFLAMGLRYLPHLFSGAIYFGSSGITYGMSPYAYSAVYNLVIAVDLAVVAVGGVILLKNKQFHNMLNAFKLSTISMESNYSTAQPGGANITINDVSDEDINNN